MPLRPLVFIIQASKINRKKKVCAGLRATAKPVAAATTPTPEAKPRSTKERHGVRVSVSEIFRARGERFNMKTASKVGVLAKKNYVKEGGRVKSLRKRLVLDGYLNPVPCTWGPGNVTENAYPLRYRGILEEAFDSIKGRAS